MSKTFMYFMKTGELVGRDNEWDGDEGYWFEYEVDEEELRNAIVDILFETYFSDEELMSFNTTQRIAIKKMIRNFTDDNDNWEELVEEFEKELKYYFEEEAFEMFE